MTMAGHLPASNITPPVPQGECDKHDDHKDEDNVHEDEDDDHEDEYNDHEDNYHEDEDDHDSGCSNSSDNSLGCGGNNDDSNDDGAVAGMVGDTDTDGNNGDAGGSVGCYVSARKWTLTLGNDTTSAIYRHGLVGSVSRNSLERRLKAREYLYKWYLGKTRITILGSPPFETRDPCELIPSSPSWAVDAYPLGLVYHRVFLYHNKRVTKPYGYIYIVDHPSWRTIVPLDEPPVNIPQEEDLHAFIALNGDLAPHPAEYTDAITNRLFYRPFRIAASTEA
ncbi:hypothetical protein EDB86DRAFT_2838927 [Lactarius hatsudake]|nr:hypothetical protein EDB86DRAFT_2838927 [Lactarius hatsudake]